MKDNPLTSNERMIAVILGTARYIVSKFTKEQKKKMAGVYIFVDDKAIVYDWESKEVLGNWVEAGKTITYYLNSIRSYVDNQPEDKRQFKFESVIEHELLHAVGLDHGAINKYRENKKAQASK